MANETNKLSFDGVDYLLEDHRISSIVDAIYPVGSIYMSVNSANPGTLFGGTWEQIKGRFLLGVGTPADNSNEFWGGDLTIDGTNKYSYDAGATGGSSRQPLDIKHLPSHNHPPYYDGADWGIAEYRNVPNKSGVWGAGLNLDMSGLVFGAINDGETYMTLRSSTGNTGGNVPHNNMPPYFTVYMWKRTA